MVARWRALVAGIELYALTLLGLLTFAGTMLVFVPGFGLGMIFLLPPPILAGRRLTDLVRRRTEHWTGVAVRRPYLPAPAPPVQQADGWYRHDRQLYRKPWVPAFMARTEWVLGDNATWRDLVWMLVTPVTAGVVGLLPALLVVGGVGFPVWGSRAGLPLWVAIPVGALTVLIGPAIGLAIAPRTLRGVAWFNRRLLGEPRQQHHRVREWAVRTFLPVLRLAVLMMTSFLGVPIFAATMLVLVLGYGLGMFFLIPMVIEDLRWLANCRRSLAHWSGLSIPSPYRPLPPTIPRPDGLYQVGKALYKTRRWAQWAQRWRWLLNDPATWREILWRGVDPIVGGLIAGVPVVMVGYGIWGLVIPRIIQSTFGGPGGDWYGAVAGWEWPAIPVGLLLAWLGVKIAPAALRLYGRWTRVLLGPTTGTVLAQRVEQLTQTRADASESSTNELRRIERDLHDGAQARFVAVGMSLATIERLMDTDPRAARELLAKTRESAVTALQELREVVRGIHPPVLAERGLVDAIRALALDSPLAANVTVRLSDERLPDPIAAAVYFAVAEALGNAARHARASTVDILLDQSDNVLRVVVRDNGKGGADPHQGTGLRGLARRLGIFDGTVTISSPPGGPTELTMEIPCASSSPRTSTF